MVLVVVEAMIIRLHIEAAIAIAVIWGVKAANVGEALYFVHWIFSVTEAIE